MTLLIFSNLLLSISDRDGKMRNYKTQERDFFGIEMVFRLMGKKLKTCWLTKELNLKHLKIPRQMCYYYFLGWKVFLICTKISPRRSRLTPCCAIKSGWQSLSSKWKKYVHSSDRGYIFIQHYISGFYEALIEIDY